MQKPLSLPQLRLALFAVILSCSAYAYYYLYAQQPSAESSPVAVQSTTKEQQIYSPQENDATPTESQPLEEEPMILPDIQLLQDILRRGKESIPVLSIF